MRATARPNSCVACGCVNDPPLPWKWLGNPANGQFRIEYFQNTGSSFRCMQNSVVPNVWRKNVSSTLYGGRVGAQSQASNDPLDRDIFGQKNVCFSSRLLGPEWLRIRTSVLCWASWFLFGFDGRLCRPRLQRQAAV